MDRPPAIDPELVKAFVIAGHGNMEQLQVLLEQGMRQTDLDQS